MARFFGCILLGLLALGSARAAGPGPKGTLLIVGGGSLG